MTGSIAITRQVSPAINQCELTHLERQPIDLQRAQTQHQEYEEALRSLGVEVVSLPPAAGFARFGLCGGCGDCAG